MKKIKLIFSFITIVLAVLIISLTIGKEIIAGHQLSLLSFTIVNFAGYLFFLLMPVEVLVPYYISAGHKGYLIILLAVGGALVAQVINYVVGYLMSAEVIHSLIGKKRYKKIEDKIHSYGIWAILFFNLFPLSSSVLSLAAGMVRFKLKSLLLYTFIGLTIKYFILIYLSASILG